MKVSAEDSDRSVKRSPTTQQNPQQASETESSQVDIPSTTATQVRVKSCFPKKIRSMSFFGQFSDLVGQLLGPTKPGGVEPLVVLAH